MKAEHRSEISEIGMIRQICEFAREWYSAFRLMSAGNLQWLLKRHFKMLESLVSALLTVTKNARQKVSDYTNIYRQSRKK